MFTLHRMPQSTGQVPEAKALPARLIVLCAFDRDDEGSLQPAFEPREIPDERRAVLTAKEMARRHAGVITWSREANPAVGEYGPSEVLFRAGDVPDLD